MFNTNYSKGVEWYKNNFLTQKKIAGESSPNYSKWDNTFPMIKMHLGYNVKFIYILRDPIKRFVSQCNHQQKDPNEIIQNKSYRVNEIFTNGLYFSRLEKIKQEYNIKDHLLLIKLEDLTKDKEKTLRQVFKFLDIDPEKYPWDIKDKKMHATAQKEIASSTAIRLASNPYWSQIKKQVKNLPIGYLLKKIYHHSFYSKRNLYSLSDASFKILQEYYREDLTSLKKHYGIDYS